MVDVARIALAAERAVEGSLADLGRYLAYAPISSDPEAKSRLAELASVLRDDLAKLGLERDKAITSLLKICQ
jgi:hypothetical protein